MTVGFWVLSRHLHGFAIDSTLGYWGMGSRQHSEVLSYVGQCQHLTGLVIIGFVWYTFVNDSSVLGFGHMSEF